MEIYLHIIFTLVPFSKSNNLTHTGHNGTEETLNERENACLDKRERTSIAHIATELHVSKRAISDLKPATTVLPDNTIATRKAGTGTKKKTTDVTNAVWPKDVMLITTANLKK